jgi:hypothetical protein
MSGEIERIPPTGSSFVGISLGICMRLRTAAVMMSATSTNTQISGDTIIAKVRPVPTRYRPTPCCSAEIAEHPVMKPWIVRAPPATIEKIELTFSRVRMLEA